MELGNIWVELWGADRFYAAPAYVRDPHVRLGIKNVLLLDRIGEEYAQMDLEADNHHLELGQQLLTTCIALKTIRNSDNTSPEYWLIHRLHRTLEDLVDERDEIQFTGDSSRLWNLSISALIRYSKESRPIG
ncbi:hypothetical protein M422DRAFT_254397, partial [Sphaerobolus stellatus SS14]